MTISNYHNPQHRGHRNHKLNTHHDHDNQHRSLITTTRAIKTVKKTKACKDRLAITKTSTSSARTR